VVAAGTATPGIAGLLTATGTRLAIATITWVSGLFFPKLTDNGRCQLTDQGTNPAPDISGQKLNLLCQC